MMKCGKLFSLLVIGCWVLAGVGCNDVSGPTPSPAGPIEILQPKGGETYKVGEVVTIKWKINDLTKVSSIGVEFDSTGLFVSKNVYEELVDHSLPPETTSVSWTVKSGQISKRCKIRVYEYFDNCDPDTTSFFTITN